MAPNHELDCLVKRLDCSVVVKVKGKVKNSSECSSQNISPTAEPFVTKLGMVMHYHGPECYARKQICCLQVQGHSEGSYDQIYDCF